MLDPHGALIYTMVIVSAAESNLSDNELQVIGDIIGHLPVFRGFDRRALPKLLNGCTEALARVMLEAESKEQIDRLAEAIVESIRSALGA